MPKYVTFGSLSENDYFFARGRFHCKGSIGLFQKPDNSKNITYNAFYFDGPTGKWTHFDEPTLVQEYDESIHGQPADILTMRGLPIC